MRDIKTIRTAIRKTRDTMKAKGIKRKAGFNDGQYGDAYFLNRDLSRLEAELKEAQPKAFRVTWWQYINLGGLGRVERGEFPTRREAKAFVENNSGGMSKQDRRRWKIEPVCYR